MATSFINIKGLAKRITEVQHELSQLLHLQSFIGKTNGKKRGRTAKRIPPSELKNAQPTVKRKRRSGKRGALGAGIIDFLSAKGKAGAHVKDIAVALGSKPANVTAWTYTTGKNKVKKVKPATFAIKE